MGSLSSRPTVPSQTSTPTFVQPAPIETPAVGAPAITDTDASASQERTQSLLRRNRGITGTIQTGFRGLLSAQNETEQRKTLLGE